MIFTKRRLILPRAAADPSMDAIASDPTVRPADWEAFESTNVDAPPD